MTRPALLSLALAACHVPVVGVERESLDATALDTLVVDTAQGDLSLRGDPDATEIRAEVRVYGTPGAHAMDALDFALTESGDGEAFLGVALRGLEWPRAWADVVVTLPPHLVITGRDDSGDMIVEDVSGLDFDDHSGDFVVRRVDGDVMISDSSGDLRIEDVDGDVVVVDDSGDLVIEGVSGDVDVDDDSGDVRVDGVDGTFTVRDDSGDIYVGQVGDLVIVADGSGDVVDHRRAQPETSTITVPHRASSTFPTAYGTP